MRIVIIGGVAGGVSLAARLRRQNEQMEILLFERGAHIAYASCGMPYYFGEVIKNEDDLLIQTPKSMKERFNIDVRVNHEILSINKEKKTLRGIDRLHGEEFEIDYDKLVIATGAAPVKPNIPGIDLEKVFTIKDMKDTIAIKKLLDTGTIKKALVIGAGFIGLEAMENLRYRGVLVTVADFSNQVLPPVDFDMAVIVDQYLRKNSIKLRLNCAVKEISQNQSGTMQVEFNDGSQEEYDLIIVCIGIKPTNKIALDAGIKLNSNGTVCVDKSLMTDDSDIFAIGDVVGKQDLITGETIFLPLAGPANRQGRIAADVITGQKSEFDGTIGTAIVKIMEMSAASTGKNEKQLKYCSIEFDKVFLHPFSHASYYPDATQLTIKLLFCRKTGKIYGAQIIGFEGVDKRIDVIAAIIKMGGTVSDLQNLELSYAPPYSSVRDPAVVAGMIANNIVKGEVKSFHWHDIESIHNNDILLDVRTVKEYVSGTIKNAVNIPLNELRGNLAALPKDVRIFVFCKVGLRGYIAQKILLNSGYKDVYNLSGGIMTYKAIHDEQSNASFIK